MMEKEVETIREIKALEPWDLLEAFESCIRKGVGINSIPFIRYRKEILFRMKGGNL